MSATIAIPPRRHVPLFVALVVGGVIAAVATLGVVWQQAGDSTSPTQPPTQRAAPQHSWQQGSFALDGHVPPQAATTAATTSGGRVQIGL